MRNVLKAFLLLLSLLLTLNVRGAFYSTDKGEFSGWVSKLNAGAQLIRFKVVFDNIKYLNKGDSLIFWNESRTKQKCQGYVIAKSVKYILVKVKEYSVCAKQVHLNIGSYTQFFSQDLVNNLRMGRELVKILLKKHTALAGKLGRHKKNLDSYMDKMSAVNSRYQVLRAKLEKEWRDEIAALEEDRLSLVTEFERTKTRLDEVDYKLEKYRISDDNFTLDRWSLDPKEFTKR